MIRKAKLSDVGTIMSIINETVKEMKSYGNTQWDDNYPNSETFINDIKNDSLYVYEEDNNIKGFICIDCNQAAEYENLNWSLNEKCMVAHRIAVNTKFRNAGIATKLMSFCEELASKEGIMCGISSGTNVAAAIKLAKKLGKGKTVVTVLPDTAERYFSTPLFEG